MKHFSLSLMLTLCIGLFTNCSEEDKSSEKYAQLDQVSITTNFPEDTEVISKKINSTHKLRCILELWSRGENPILTYREEIVPGKADLVENISFDFKLKSGDYDCFLWADYIDINASFKQESSKSGEIVFCHYQDKYYDTSNLRNVSIKDVNTVFNTDACDAFFYCGQIQKKSENRVVGKVALNRPFSKVTIREKNLKEFNRLRGINAVLSIPTAFNVATGEASEVKEKVKFVNSSFNPIDFPDGTLFNIYVFANNKESTLGKITLDFLIENGLKQTDVVVPEIIPLVINQHVVVNGNMLNVSPSNSKFDITYNINITDWTDNEQSIVVTEVGPKVGDFFYKNGSYSANYIKDEKNPCIGIVFAVTNGGKAFEDKLEYYLDKDGKQKVNQLHGWVVAVNDVVKGVGQWSKTGPNLDMGTFPGSVLNIGKTDIKGFLNTESFRKIGNELSQYPAFKAVLDYEDNETTKAPITTSGWYLGAVQQYLILASEYAAVQISDGVVTSVEMKSVGKSFQILKENGVGELLTIDDDRFHWSSTIDATGKAFRVGCSIKSKYYNQTAALEINKEEHVRPILAF